MKIQKMFWNPKLIRIGPLKENTALHRGGRKYSLKHSNKFALGRCRDFEIISDRKIPEIFLNSNSFYLRK